MKKNNHNYPPFFEWAEGGLEFVYQKSKKFKNKILKNTKTNNMKKVKKKKLIDRGQRDDADALTANYLMSKSQAKVETRLKGLKIDNKDKEIAR
jgi:hypothetical protein